MTVGVTGGGGGRAVARTDVAFNRVLIDCCVQADCVVFQALTMEGAFGTTTGDAGSWVGTGFVAGSRVNVDATALGALGTGSGATGRGTGGGAGRVVSGTAVALGGSMIASCVEDDCALSAKLLCASS